MTRRAGRARNPAIKPMVDKYMMVCIEQSVGDGYIVTIGDITGPERATMADALRAARRLVEGKNDSVSA